jgi:predicted Rossmann fold nucleotide-binding protein DprA/Smf involved in DNA uptake
MGALDFPKTQMMPSKLHPEDTHYPAHLQKRLSAYPARELSTLGSVALLALPKTALFCSSRCPGKVILATYDQTAKWRDAGRCVISGFHSPVEKECLQILLRGSQPIIICPARALPRQVPPEWKKPLAAGRLLILSAFAARENRVTAALAIRRNEFVAALADEVFIVHATAGGHLDSLSLRLRLWGIPLIKPSPISHANASKHSN